MRNGTRIVPSHTVSWWHRLLVALLNKGLPAFWCKGHLRALLLLEKIALVTPDFAAEWEAALGMASVSPSDFADAWRWLEGPSQFVELVRFTTRYHPTDRTLKALLLTKARAYKRLKDFENEEGDDM